MLPIHFTSLYRLFLRATSAAVLNNGPGARGLRRIYRPTFEAAARVIHRGQNLNSSSQETQAIKQWLAEFDKRANGTLELLHNSSLSRGLPHRTILHLFHLARSDYAWSKDHQEHPVTHWNPQLQRDDVKYMPGSYLTPSLRKRKAELKIQNKAWNGLGEVIQMAEGRDGLLLGKVRFKRAGTKTV